MKVLVTGATGLVGAHTVLELLRHQHQVRILVRDKNFAEQWFLGQGIRTLDIVEGDMLHLDHVTGALADCDAVVHAAAVVDLDAQHRDMTAQKNLTGVENVVQTACHQGIKKIIYVSSVSAIFDAKLATLDENRPVSENKDPYSRSKALCEQKVRALQQQGYPIIITYPTGIFAPDDPKLSQSNEGLMLLYKDFVPLTSSGMQFVDARDVGKAHCLLLESELAQDKTQERYILGGHFLPWKVFAQTLNRVGRHKVKTIYLPGWFFRLLGMAFDLARYAVNIKYPISYESSLMVTRMPICQSDKVLRKTGMQFRPAEQTLGDTLEWLYRVNYLQK